MSIIYPKSVDPKSLSDADLALALQQADHHANARPMEGEGAEPGKAQGEWSAWWWELEQEDTRRLWSEPGEVYPNGGALWQAKQRKNRAKAAASAMPAWALPAGILGGVLTVVGGVGWWSQRGKKRRR